MVGYKPENAALTKKMFKIEMKMNTQIRSVMPALA